MLSTQQIQFDKRVIEVNHQLLLAGLTLRKR